jgi:2-polyprenyl-6-methoxyphenol hydroxylase-like FAD-dependent oxidoreductase
MQPLAVDVCIIGGGIAGLTAAIGLKLAGASVVVIERRSDLGDPHRGDWIQPRAAALLQKWGVDLAARRAVPATTLVVEWGSRPVARRKLKGDSFFLPASQLEAALRDRARALGVDLRLGWQMQQLLHAGQGRVAGVTASSGADFGAFQTKLLVGADGRSSVVREQIGLRFKKAEADHALLAVEAEVAISVNIDAAAMVISVGSQGGGLASPLPNRRLRVQALMGPGEAEALSRKPPHELASALPLLAPLPLGSSIDPAKVRVYESLVAGHSTNYAAAGAVCVGEAAHPGPIPLLDGITMACLDAEALARITGPAIAQDERAIDRSMVKFETERWPDNERRLLRARKVLRWLRPKGALWGVLLRTPLARLFLGSLLAVD